MLVSLFHFAQETHGKLSHFLGRRALVYSLTSYLEKWSIVFNRDITVALQRTQHELMLVFPPPLSKRSKKEKIKTLNKET